MEGTEESSNISKKQLVECRGKKEREKEKKREGEQISVHKIRLTSIESTESEKKRKS